MYWPFAYTDMYDYALWGPPYAAPFWTYGYNDIYTGIFGPYGYDTMTGYFPRYASAYPTRRGRASRNPEAADPLAQMCNADAGDIAGLPVDQIQALIDLVPISAAHWMRCRPPRASPPPTYAPPARATWR